MEPIVLKRGENFLSGHTIFIKYINSQFGEKKH
jgi:hypothetical protein